MDGADIVHHTDLRLGDFAQGFDLTGYVEAHLKDGYFMFRFQVEQGQGQADLIITVARIFQEVVFKSKQGSGQFFG